MFNVSRRPKSPILELEMSGVLDENVDLARAVGDLDGVSELRFVTSGLQRINSTGIKHWIGYLQSLRERGVRIRMFDTSRALVEQANFIRGFLRKEEVASIVLPYFCANCRADRNEVIPVEMLDRPGFEPPEKPCPTCKQPMEFDEVLEEYFSFWDRS